MFNDLYKILYKKFILTFCDNKIGLISPQNLTKLKCQLIASKDKKQF